MYTIKRYANGRFYDTEEKTFIRREQIAGMMAAKKKFVIVDTRTGKDITGEITAQIQAKKGGAAETGTGSGKQEASSEAQAGALMDFLRKSGDSLYQWGRKYAARGQDLLSESWQELDKRINRLVAEKKITEGEGDDLKGEISRHSESLRNWLGSRVEKAVEEVIQRMNLATRQELDALEKKIDSLNQRISRMEKEDPPNKNI